MLYLLYDTALNSGYTLMLLKKHYEKNRSLFAGTKDAVLADCGPWLFEVDDRLWDKLDSEIGASNRYPVLLESAEDIDVVCVHLRQFIYQTIDGREYFFRFWDGRVLAKFLPGCDKKQVEDLFGNIQYFLAGGEGQGAMRFSHRSGVLTAEEQKMVYSDKTMTA
jgi:hypothetical protein